MGNNSVTNYSKITGLVSFLLPYDQVFMVHVSSKFIHYFMKQKTRNESELFFAVREIISNQRMHEGKR